MKHTILLLLILILPNIVRAQSPADSCVITSLPYVQDFEEYTIVSQGADSVFVPCWHRMGSTANPTSCIYISTPGVAVEENTEECKGIKITNTSYACIVLPRVDSALCSGGALQLRVRIIPTSRILMNLPIEVRAGFMTNPSDTSTFTTLCRYPLPDATQPYELLFPLAGLPPSGAHTALLFKIYTNYSLFVDKVTVERTPVCGSVCNLNCAATARRGAGVAWDFHPGTASDSLSYVVRVYPAFNGAALPPDSAALQSFVTHERHAVVRHLLPNTTYSIVVSAAECVTGGAPQQWAAVTLRTLLGTDSCSAPTIVYAEGDSGSIALEWIPNTAVATAWEISYRTANLSSGPVTVAADACTDSCYTISGLLPGTTYAVTLRPVCDSRMAARCTVTTTCLTRQLPFYEDFENFNPTCWSFFPSGRVNLDMDYEPSVQGLCVNMGDDIFHVLPELEVEAHNVRLSGKMATRHPNPNSHTQGFVVAGVMAYDSAAPTFIPHDTIRTSYNNRWEHFTVHFRDYTGPDGRIALWAPMSFSYMFIDDILVERESQCPEPDSVTVSIASFSTATVHWRDGGNAGNYEVEYGPHGFAHGEGTTLGVFTDSVVLTGLQHSCNYDVYIRSHCPGDTSVWSFPVSFTTPCGDINQLPYVENFDQWEPSGRNYVSLPPCWAFSSRCSTPYFFCIYIERYTTESGGLSNCLGNHSEAIATMHLPRIRRERVALEGTEICFKAWKTGGMSPYLIVGVDTDTMSHNSFTPIDTVYPTEIPTYYEVFFDHYSGTGEFIVFKTQGENIYLDDIVVDYLPSCPRPDHLAATQVDSTHALISWHPNGIADQWQIAYGRQGFDPDTGGFFATVPVDSLLLSGLMPATEYDVYIRSICSVDSVSMTGDTSGWTYSPLTFATTQSPAHVPYYCDFEDSTEARRWQEGSNMAYHWRYGAIPADTSHHGYLFNTVEGELNRHSSTVPVNMVMYRDIDFGTASPAGTYDSSVAFSYRILNIPATLLTSARLVVCMVNPAQPVVHSSRHEVSPWGIISDLNIIAEIPMRTGWQTDTVELDTLHGIRRIAIYQTGFSWDDYTGTLVSIDEVNFFHTPCPRPFNVSADSIGDTEATLSWYGDSAATYIVTYTSETTYETPSYTFTDTAYSNHILLTGLTPASTYTASVQLVCGDSSLSSPSESYTFNTLLCADLRSDTLANCIAPGTYDSISRLLPVVSYDDYSYSQQIYEASRLSGPGTIQAINLNLGPPSEFYSSRNESRIYLGHTWHSRFNTPSDFIDPSSLQLVYIGPMPVRPGWNRIVLQSPFEYDGMSNLVLAVLNNGNPIKPQHYMICPASEATGIVVHGHNAVDPYTVETLDSYTGDKTLVHCTNQAVFDFCPPGSCPQVRLKRPNLRYSRVNLRWQGDTASLYEVNYRLLSRNQWDTVFTTDTLLTIDNVFTNHEYLYRVRKVCTDEGTPVWSYGTFRTSPHDCAFPEDMHITGLTHKKASFRWTPDENNTTYTLHIFNTAFDTTVTSIIARASISGLPAGLTFHAAVRAHCSPDNHPGDWSDTITFTTPVCPEVTDLTYSDLQGNSVVLDWQCDPDVTQWEVQFGPIGFTQGYGITSYTDHHPYTLTGLTGETDYDIYVRSVCDDDWFSEHWSNPVTVTTPYSSIADPGSTSPLFTLSPNPATGSVTVTVNSQLLTLNSQLLIVLRDAAGRELLNTQLSILNSQFSIPPLPAGVYYVTLVTPQATATRKLVIQR